MKITKRTRLLAIYGTIFLLFLRLVSAQTISNALQPLILMFGQLHTMLTSGAYSHYFMRLILWIIMVNVLLHAIRRVPSLWGKESVEQKQGKMIAVFISLAGVLMLPTKAVENMFFTFQILIIIAFIASIYNYIVGIANSSGKPKAGAIAIIGGILLLVLNNMFFGFPPFNNTPVLFGTTLYDLLLTIGWILIIAGLIMLFNAGSGNVTGRPISEEEVSEPGFENETPKEIRMKLAAEINALDSKVKLLYEKTRHWNMLCRRLAGGFIGPLHPGIMPRFGIKGAKRDTLLMEAAEIEREISETEQLVEEIKSNAQYTKLSRKYKRKLERIINGSGFISKRLRGKTIGQASLRNVVWLFWDGYNRIVKKIKGTLNP